MRSGIFTKFADLPQEFKDDFVVLWSLDRNQRQQLVEFIGMQIGVETERHFVGMLEEMLRRIGGQTAQVLRAIKLVKFIYQEWNPLRDTPESFMTDMIELGFIPQDKLKEGTEFLISLLAEIQKDNPRRLRKAYANSLLPSFESVTTLVEFRAVIENPYVGGDDLAQYNPRVSSAVPIVLVRIVRDSGTPKSTHFQCEEGDLRKLVSALQAALKDLENARNALREGGLTCEK